MTEFDPSQPMSPEMEGLMAIKYGSDNTDGEEKSFLCTNLIKIKDFNLIVIFVWKNLFFVQKCLHLEKVSKLTTCLLIL